MATKKKMLQAAAGQAGGAGLNVEEVFSTYLYTGNSSTQTITNNIDLDGEGGLVWFKRRSTEPHRLVDTERGSTKYISSNDTTAEETITDGLTSFNSDGFNLGVDSAKGSFNESGQDYASWTFRKAPKFFTCVTWTGDGTSNRAIPHNLGGAVGSYFVKCTSDSTASDWIVWHKDLSSNAHNLVLNTTAAQDTNGLFSTTAPDSSNVYLGTSNLDYFNATGRTYVAYIFAHNDGDGEFGPDGDADIIKCGSFEATTGSTTVDVGFEPQFILHKKVNATGSWVMWDTMRGYSAPDGDTNGAGGDAKYLYADLTNSEPTTNHGGLTSNGFVFPSNFAPGTDPGDTYIYIAIRRGTKVPESATEVFAVDNLQNPTTVPAFQSGFPVDLALVRNVNTTYDMYVKDRLRGTLNLQTNTTAAELSFFSTADFDYMNGWYNSGTNTDFYSWMWKRAPGFFDAVAYTGNDTPRTLPHNLGAAPEMIITKSRTGTGSWWTYHSGLNVNGDGRPETDYVMLNSTQEARDFNVWNDTAPTDTVFSLGSFSGNNETGTNYIAYLFASLDGISKVGSYTGNGTSQTINCGFTSGARFVLIKRTDGTGNWIVFDTARGIVSGTDPHLFLNTTDAEDTGHDLVDPASSGFVVNNDNTAFSYQEVNANGANYIFYAIA